jgi:hypothetical protein
MVYLERPIKEVLMNKLVINNRKGSFVGEVYRVRADLVERKLMCFPDPKSGEWIRFWKDVNVENYNTWVWIGTCWVTQARYNKFNKRGKLDVLIRIERNRRIA